MYIKRQSGILSGNNRLGHHEFDSPMAYKGLSNKQFSTGVKTVTGQEYYLVA